MTAKGFIVGMVVGGIVGAGAALLLAPLEGTETRRKIVDKSRAAKERVSEVASVVKGHVKPVREAVKQAM